MEREKKIAIIGATGNVGRIVLEELSCKKEYELSLFASQKSAGTTLGTYIVGDIESISFKEYAYVIFCTGSGVSSRYVPKALEAGSTVIDTSSFYRLEEGVPLIVPPVNGKEWAGESSLYTTANCIVSPLMVALGPLHNQFGLKRLTLSTYQSTSGAGREAMEGLYRHTQAVLEGREERDALFPREIAFNIIPQIGKFSEEGVSGEEEKIVAEAQKVLGKKIPVLVTAVRVPVKVGHAISVTAEFETDCALEEAKALLQRAPGVVLSDSYSTPLEVEGSDYVFVGRIRKESSLENTLSLWIVSDNLRRGAALDVLELLELLEQTNRELLRV